MQIGDKVQFIGKPHYGVYTIIGRIGVAGLNFKIGRPLGNDPLGETREVKPEEIKKIE